MNLLTFLKEFSIPGWLLLFSVAWLLFKWNVLKHEHLEKIMESALPKNSALAILEIERRKGISHNLEKLKNAKESMKGLEIATCIAGVLAGLIGVVFYWVN